MQLELLLEPFMKIIEQNGYDHKMTMKIMDLKRGMNSGKEIAGGLKRVCGGLMDDSYYKIVRIILQGQYKIDYGLVADKVQHYFKEVYQKQRSEDQQLLDRLRSDTRNYQVLKSRLNKMDVKMTGWINDRFLMEEIVKSVDTVDRRQLKGFIVRLEKDDEGMVDYNCLLDLVKQKDCFQLGIERLAIRLDRYLRDNLMDYNQLLFRIDDSQQCSIDEFYEFIVRNVELEGLDMKLVKKIDIDQNGVIDPNDLEIFLQRYKYIDQNRNQKLYPREKLDEKQIDRIVMEIRRRLELKRIKLYDYFRLLDRNNDGFIDIDEWKKGIRQIIELSIPIVEGMFAYMDDMKIGLVDSKRFMQVVRKCPGIQISEVGDDFKWQQQVISQIRSFIITNKVDADDLFRIIDKQFEENISQSSLKQFLLKDVKVKQEEMKDTQIERLYKLWDVNKKGLINKNEFRKVYESLLVDDHNKLESQFDWLKCVKQQIGIYLVNKFGSISRSFEAISGNQSQLLFGRFSNYMNQKQILQGFNLTERLMQGLFSYFDKHSKGYLTFLDWKQHFGEFDKEGLMYQQFVDSLVYNFDGFDECFRYLGGGGSIDRARFCKGVNSLLPQRYCQKDIDQLYSIINDGHSIDRSTLHGLIAHLFKNHLNNRPNHNRQIGGNTDKQVGSIIDRQAGSIIDRQAGDIIDRQVGSIIDRQAGSIIDRQAGDIIDRQAGSNIRQNSNKIRQSSNNSNRQNNRYEVVNQNNSSLVSELYQSGKQILGYKPKIYRVENQTNSWRSNGRQQYKSLLLDPNQTYNHQLNDKDRVVDRMKDVIKWNRSSIMDRFRELDTNGQGILTNLQFRKILRVYGFSSKDIDLLFGLIEQLDGNINYKQFVQKLETSEIQKQIIQRPRQILQKLKTGIVYYFINVKDAFKRFNSDGSGLMKQEEFNSLIEYVYQKNGEQQPVFAVVKELFDFIDRRQDGVIDINEWMQSFKRIECDQQLGSQQNADSVDDVRKNDDVMFLIAKNRKLLAKRFGELSDRLVNVDQACRILVDVLAGQGIHVDHPYLKYIIEFSRDKHNRSKIDYHSMLDVFKSRQRQINYMLI